MIHKRTALVSPCKNLLYVFPPRWPRRPSSDWSEAQWVSSLASPFSVGSRSSTSYSGFFWISLTTSHSPGSSCRSRFAEFSAVNKKFKNRPRGRNWIWVTNNKKCDFVTLHAISKLVTSFMTMTILVMLGGMAPLASSHGNKHYRCDPTYVSNWRQLLFVGYNFY